MRLLTNGCDIVVLSMTGYGRARCESDLFQITVEMKSVNHRFAEINIRMPRQFLIFEDKIKKIIGSYVQRGRIEVFITVEGEGLVKRSIQIDWDLMDEIFQKLTNVKEKYSLKDEISLGQLWKNDETFTIIEKEAENDELESLLLKAVHTAATNLKNMRIQEGKQLKAVICEFLNEINRDIDIVAEHAPQVIEHYQKKLQKRMNEFSDGIVDENRILAEVAIYADKADITEEITRIKSHLVQFHETLENNRDPIGRKLDFLVQEFNREINTIGSKANDGFIALKVVEMKSNLEKIREQVQNIE